jgi:AraC family transcriptional regulator, ethanolamine operon transcriptional activator
MDGLPNGIPEGTPLGRAAADRRRTFERAVDCLCARFDRPIYTGDLRAALGVSAFALEEAFRAVVGTSPQRFLKLRRLVMVRSVLLDRERGRPPVKSVALLHGFWHLGRFARDYRETFGETPSDTVARVHGSEPTE